MATPTKQDSVVTNPGGTGSSIVPALSSHAANDVIEIWVTKTGNAAWSAPAGWTIARQVVSPGTSSTATMGTLLYRRVLSTDTLPLSSPTCTLGATVTRHAVARTIRGADIESVYLSPSWSAIGTGSGTSNPIRPASVTTPAPEMLVTHYYCQRVATNAPEPSGYTQDQEVITSGTLVTNVSQKNVSEQTTTLSNQDASPTSGGRWAAVITCAPSVDYPYYRSGSQATATGTSVTPAKPTGTTHSDQRGNKDVMIATVEAAGTPNIDPVDFDLWHEIPAWTGFTSGNGSSIKKFWCHATASPNMTFTRETSGEISVCVTTYYNCHQSSPVGNNDADPRASSTTSTWDAVTRGDSRSVMHATCVADATPSFTSPAGWLERMDGLGIVCSDQTYQVADVTGADSFTLSAASPSRVGLVELKGLLAGGGADLTLTLSDNAADLVDNLLLGRGLVFTENAANLVDTHTEVLEHRETLADNANNLTDAYTQQLGVTITATDSLSLSDNRDLLLGYEVAITDAQSLSDSLALGQGLVAADVISFSDNLGLGHGLIVSDTVNNLADAYAQQLSIAVDNADSFALADALELQLGYEIEFAEPRVVTVDYATACLYFLGVEIECVDSEARIAFQLYDSLDNWADAKSIALSYEVLLTDNADALAEMPDLALGQLTAFTDDADNLADFSRFQLEHLLSFGDAIILTDSQSQALTYLISFSDDADNLADHVALDLQGIAAERTINVSDSFALNDALALNLHHLLPFGDAIALTDATSFQQGQLVEFSDAFTLADVTVLRLVHLLSFADALALSDSATVDSSAREQVFSDSLAQSDSITLILGHWVSSSDGLQQTDAVVIAATGPERLVSEFDSLNNWADSVEIDRNEIGGYELVFTDMLTLTDHEFILRGPYSPSQKRKTVVPLRARTTVVPKRKEPTTV